MKETQKILMIALWVQIVLCIVISLIFETNLAQPGVAEGNTQLQFGMSITMQLVTICIIPLALRLFKFKSVNRRLTEGSEELRAMQLRKWGLLRIDMLCIPMTVNLIFYYLTMVVGFCYMAIMLALCLFFIYPSKERCNSETQQ